MDKFNAIEEENKRTAIMEAIDSYTVAIAGVGEKTVWGTGTPIKFREKFYILTCLHVLEDEPINENLRFIPRTDAPLEMGSKNNIFKYPVSSISKSYRISLPIIYRIVSDEIDHLAILNLDSSVSNVKNINFYELKENSKTPPVESHVGLLGFSIEIARKLGKLEPNVIGIGVAPYFDWSKIVGSNDDDLEKFDKEKHFLIEFTKSETSCDPRGLSGCGIWASYVNPGKIWNPNLRLVGVETHSYPKPQILRATKVERVLELLGNNY